MTRNALQAEDLRKDLHMPTTWETVALTLALTALGLAIYQLIRERPESNGNIRALTKAVEKEGILKKRVERLERLTNAHDNQLKRFLDDAEMAEADNPPQ